MSNTHCMNNDEVSEPMIEIPLGLFLALVNGNVEVKVTEIAICGEKEKVN